MEQLEHKLDNWIKAHKEEILAHAKNLIRIPSINKFDPAATPPCGTGCAAALDYVLDLANQMGLEIRNYDYYAGAARLPGRTQKTIGIFVHLDTTTCNDVWSFRPFEPEVRNGYLMGCGAQDNKGAAITMLYLLRALKDLNIQLDHTVALVFGCDKKGFMRDIDHYLKCEPAPSLSLIADADFPVCLGEKGSLDLELICPVTNSQMVDFHAGRASNMVPDQAFVMLEGLDYQQVKERLCNEDRCSVVPVGSYVKIASGTLGGHAAFPENTHSPIPVLASILLDNGFADAGSEPILQFLRNSYSTCQGAPLDVDVRDDMFGYTTHVCALVRMQNHVLQQLVNIRYVPSLDADEIVRRVSTVAESAGIQVKLLASTPPSTIGPQMQPIASLLTSITNRVLGTRLHGYTMGGVTYVKKLPNAIPFGLIRRDLPTPFGIGHSATRGGGHQADEVISVQSLLDGLKIYAVSLVRVDSIV